MRKLLPFFLLTFAAHVWADAIYVVGPAATYASVAAALAQAASDHPGPLGVTVRVQVQSGSIGPLLLDPAHCALLPQPGFGLVIESALVSGTRISGAGAEGIRVSGLAQVSLRGFQVQGFSQSQVSLQNAPGVSVSGLDLRGGAVAALLAESCPNLSASGCLLAPAGGAGALLSACAQARLNGLYVPAGSAASYGVELIYSDGAWIEACRADGANAAFNVFNSAGVTVSAAVAVARGADRGLVLDGSPDALVLRCLLVGQAIGIELQASPRAALLQNTVWEHPTAALWAHAFSDHLTSNNGLWQGFLALVLDGTSLTGLASDHNGLLADGPLVVAASTYNSLGAWQAAGQDSASASVDPHFINAPGSAPEDYKLSVNSPAQGLGADLSALVDHDYFGDPLPPPALTPWDPGFHVLAALQYTPTPSPIPTPAQPTATPSITPSPTMTPDSSATPPGTLTATPSISPTFTLTPTLSPTALPLKPGRIISYPNPYKPEAGPLRFVFDPAQRASLRLYDMSTALVRELSASDIQAGLGTALWDGRDRAGQPVPNGLYLCVLATEGGSKFSRFTVLH